MGTFDYAIIGGGAAGINSAIYAVRRGLSVAIFEPGQVGGIINTTPYVENYLGYAKISGQELAAKFDEHLSSYPEVSRFSDKVVDLKRTGDTYLLATDSGEVHKAKAVLLATGAAPRKIGAPGEAEFSGKGVSYCAICDAPIFKGKKVAVVGGGDSALTAALLVADISPEVYLIHRRDEFRGENTLIENVKSRGNIKILYNKAVSAIKGGKFVERLELKDGKSGATDSLDVSGVFVYIGHEPASELAKKVGAKVDAHGFILTSGRMEATLPGLYAAGDVRAGSLAQLITSAADGCAAGLAAAEFVKHKPSKNEA